jgi:hypothetical protein
VPRGANRSPFTRERSRRDLARVRTVHYRDAFLPKRRRGKSGKNCGRKSSSQRPSSTPKTITEMPNGTLEFKCIRINLRKTSTFGPDENQIDSLIEFDLRIGDECLRDLSTEVRQPIGTDFQSQPLEVGNVIGYDGPWNSEEFREICERYYRAVIGSCGVGPTINRGNRNLIERVSIRLHRREEINLPPEGTTSQP